MRFTKEEFDTMVRELLFQKTVSFDMLCHIAEKTLSQTVANWCKTEDCLRGRDYEDDIMQEIYLRLIKTTVPNFLLRSGDINAYNNDPEGFEDWMFAVAKNIKRDVANKVRGIDFKTVDVEDEVLENLPAEEAEDNDVRIEVLKQSFDQVLSADVKVYKVLTWLAQSLFMLEHDVSKIESNGLIVSAFASKTLDEMYDMLLAWSVRIPWLTITEAQNAKIRGDLRKKESNGVSYGEMQYQAFFMKQDGVPAGKKSISDWMNRLNGRLRRLQGKTIDFAPQSTKKTPGENGDKKGRGGDEASNC